MSDKQQNSGQTPNDAAKLRKRAEEQARTMEPTSLSGQAPEAIQQMLHELRVYQIELEMQNEELRMAQVEIEAGRTRYFDLYDLAPVGYCTLSEKGLILEANLPAATLLGTARSALVKQPISRYILKEDQDIYYLHRKKLFETGEPQECELRLVNPDGTFFWAHLTATAAQAEDGAPVCRCVMSEVTERKRAEEAFGQQQQAIKLFNRIANVFLTSSRNEVFADVLDVILKALDSRYGYFGYIDEAGDLVCASLTRDVWEQCQVSEKSIVFPRSSWGGLWGRSLMEKQALIANENLRLPEGHVTLENALAIPIVYDDKLLGQFVLANKAGGYDKHDRELLESTAVQTAPILFAIQEEARRKITHKKLENQLRQAQKMESIGRLAGGVAHDFNNMLGVILGYTEMALEKLNEDDPLHKDLSEVLQAAERSADLTRQLLAFARKQTITPKVIDINKTVEEMLKMLRRLIGEDIDLIWLPGRNLRPVKMDPTQIDQILANLCVTPGMPLKVWARSRSRRGLASFDEAWCAVHTEIVPGEYVLLAVSDNGCGMDRRPWTICSSRSSPPRSRARAPDSVWPRCTARSSRTTASSTYTANPVRERPSRSTCRGHVIKTESLSIQTPVNAAPRGHETILLVEDEPAILEMTARMLGRLGYTVVAAATPGGAIRLAAEHTGHIDLLMTDVIMPEMNGRELAGNLLSHYPDLKRLFMSGYTANVIAHHGVLDEGVHFIQKPFSKADMAAKLREALEG